MSLAAVVTLHLLAAPDSVDALIAQMPRVATSVHGVSADAQALAVQLQAKGPEAIPKLLPLLEGGSEATRAFAGYVLRDIEGLREEHVDRLLKALRAGNGWIAPAIAHTGSARGINALADELAAHPSTRDQLNAALREAGDAGAIALATRLQSPRAHGQTFADALCEVLADPPRRATSVAAAALLKAALDTKAADKNRSHAIRALGCLGPAASETRDALKQLDPKFAAEVELALIGIGGPEAVDLLLKRATPDKLVFAIVELAELRDNGRPAGPRLVEWLQHDDWDVRVAAARALGVIGYHEASQALIAALADDADWKLVAAAAESLGRFRALAAVPALQVAAKSHWDDVTRGFASRALAAIEGRGDVDPIDTLNFRLWFFDDLRGEHRPTPVILFPGKGELPAAKLAAITFTNQSNETSLRGRPDRPTCGLQTAEGLLLGTDHGEWGGELVLRKRDGSIVRLLAENTHAVHQLGSTAVALVGLAHLSMNDGFVYRVEGEKAVRWKRLPGAPQISGFRHDGRLVITCYGGAVAVTPDGKLVAP